jgi:D-glycerate 3-kinase
MGHFNLPPLSGRSGMTADKKNDRTFLPSWPAEASPLSAASIEETALRLIPLLTAEPAAGDIGDKLYSMLTSFHLPLAAWLAKACKGGDHPLVVGINGAQGAGKSTLCRLLQIILQREFGLRVVGFSIDDLYLTRAEREDLARTVHPLLATRGVPGTHDVALGLRTLEALREARRGEGVPVPAFDKARDDRRPEAQWPLFEGPVEMILFEGWCVGARPQAKEALAEPVNDLERREDADGAWRRYVNRRLAGAYAGLFAEVDLLIMLQVPGMESVFEWRRLQERRLVEKMRDSATDKTGLRVMDEPTLRRFIMHYERLTRHMLSEMPSRADVVLRLNERHAIDGVRIGQNRP